MKVLHLTLKKKWFDMIAAGEKLEEYREIKTYWISRLVCNMSWDIDKGSIKINADKRVINRNSYEAKKFDVVKFTNGYAKDAPTITVECLGIEIGLGKMKWGSEGKEYFVIKLGAIVPPTK